MLFTSKSRRELLDEIRDLQVINQRLEVALKEERARADAGSKIIKHFMSADWNGSHYTRSGRVSDNVILKDDFAAWRKKAGICNKL